MDILNKKIILASKSPRRRFLLEEAGFTFEVKTKSVEETYPDDLPVDEVAAFLAEKKAKAAAEFVEANSILLTADSVVILGNTIYGKPKDKTDAQGILRALSGSMHRVVTGVCLLSKEKSVTFSGVSKVYMEALTKEEIDYYIDRFQPYDKAGAYAIQEWIGLCKISKIEGTYANIMGLPVDLVYKHLETF